MNNIFEIGMKIEIYENRLFSIKNDLKIELNKSVINWGKVHELSINAVGYSNKIKENFQLKLKYIEDNV